MTEVTLKEVLAARDARAEKQKELLFRFQCPLISFTMNIAGPIKTSPLIKRAFYEGIRLIKESLPQECCIHHEISTTPTGCEAMFCVKLEAEKLKEICLSIEDATNLGRLFDMDVITESGTKLERKTPRNCLVCGAPGRACAAGRRHSVSVLQAVTNEIIENYFFTLDRERYSALAVTSLIDEVYTTPKPGLVDRRNNGSHSDMNVNTFVTSAKALKPYFAKCFSIGHHTAHLSHSETFSALRKAGIAAEVIMFKATDGVNTHKGAIYSMGTLCAALGRLWQAENPPSQPELICLESAKLVQEAVKVDFEHISTATAGGRLYIKYGLGGIRAEVASGFGSVLQFALPCYTKLLNENFSPNDAGVITLLHLIATVKDTNLYHRGDKEGAEFAEKSAKELLQNNPTPSMHQIQALDDAFIKKNLSPGGCADLLAVTYFLYALASHKN